MANLIITIIAIALVAVAALMGAYYGGTAFNQGQTKAKASALMNQAAQIQAAAQMWRVENGTDTATMGQLVDADLLASIPQLDGADWTVSVASDGTGTASNAATTIEATSTNADGVCAELEKQVGSVDGSNAWTCADNSVSYAF